MARLRCTSNYASSAGAWTTGDLIDVSDEVAEFLLRDSEASFERVGQDAPPAETVSEAVPEVPVAETSSGLEVPDRRARGGKKRGKSSEV